MPSLRSILISQTHLRHTTIQSQPLLQNLLTPHFDTWRYVLLLKELYTFWQPLEKLMTMNSAGINGPLVSPECEISSWLHRDLKEAKKLGYLPTLSLAYYTGKLLNTTSISLLGIRYVELGSTLGFSMIQQNLAKSSIYPLLPRCFFETCRLYSGSEWQKFLMILDQQARPAWDGIITTAQLTFDELRLWLDKSSINASPTTS